jgi:hypothetical protein
MGVVVSTRTCLDLPRGRECTTGLNVAQPLVRAGRLGAALLTAATLFDEI